MKGNSLMGAHRTGKTTLAKMYAEKHACHFVPMSVSPVYKRCGIPMGEVEDFEDRMLIQSTAANYYEDLIKEVAKTDEPFITDRCFLDLLAYTLVDYPQNPSEAQEAWFINYAYKCNALNAEYFDTVVMLRPGILPISEESSWSSQFGVVNQVDAGMLWSADQASQDVFKMQKSMVNLDDRLSILEVMLDA